MLVDDNQSTPGYAAAAEITLPVGSRAPGILYVI